MELLKAIYGRRSIRGYKAESVPKMVIEKILEISTRTVNGMNVQPWKFHVITGVTLDQLRVENIKNFHADGGVLVGARYEGIYRERQVSLAKHLIETMGIGREDKAAKAAWLESGFKYFDAPVAIILSVDTGAHQEKWAHFGIGSITQTICLAAQEFGVGSCVGLQGVYYPDGVKKVLGIGDEETLIISIALGYPDWSFPANHVISDREKIENITAWYNF